MRHKEHSVTVCDVLEADLGRRQYKAAREQWPARKPTRRRRLKT